jgi:hypothetical protein
MPADTAMTMARELARLDLGGRPGVHTSDHRAEQQRHEQRGEGTAAGPRVGHHPAPGQQRGGAAGEAVQQPPGEVGEPAGAGDHPDADQHHPDEQQHHD